MTYYILQDLRQAIGLDKDDGHKDTILVGYGLKGDAKAGNNPGAANAWALMLYFAGPGNDIKKAEFYKSLFDEALTSTITGSGGNIIFRSQGYRSYPLNPDATPYRSITGGNNELDDSDL